MTSFSVYKNISMFCHKFIIYVVNRNYPSKIENVQTCTLLTIIFAILNPFRVTTWNMKSLIPDVIVQKGTKTFSTRYLVPSSIRRWVKHTYVSNPGNKIVCIPYHVHAGVVLDSITKGLIVFSYSALYKF